jgi:hypothetical protein
MSEIFTKPPAFEPSFSDLFVTDPPYADAVMYHEITEFFIAWLRKNPPPPSTNGPGIPAARWRSRAPATTSAAAWWMPTGR